MQSFPISHSAVVFNCKGWMAEGHRAQFGKDRFKMGTCSIVLGALGGRVYTRTVCFDSKGRCIDKTILEGRSGSVGQEDGCTGSRLTRCIRFLAV